MKLEVLDWVIDEIILGQKKKRGQMTHTPACLWAGHPPAERSNMKHPSERLPLQERGRRGGL